MFTTERLSKYKIHKDPFPIIEIENFLSKEESKIATEIIKNSSFDELVAEGRKNIRKGTTNFYELIKMHNFYSKLYDFFNDQNIYKFLFDKLDLISNESKSKFKIKTKPRKFNKDYYEYKRTIHKINIFQKFYNYIWRRAPKIVKNLFSFCYFEMAFCMATKGYSTTIHTDKNTRILVYLLYLNDLDEKDGGNLEFYGKQNKLENLKITVPEQQDFFLTHKIKPQAGRLIVFLSNPISFHKAEKIINSSTKRCFCYGSYSSNIDIEWTKIQT